MGYQNDYIVNNDIDDRDEFVSKKTVKPVTIAQNAPSEEYEPVPEQNRGQDVIDEIHQAAVSEGLVNEDETPFGGEGNPSPKEVLDDFMNQKRSEGAQKNMEEYTEKKVEKTRKVMATREILTGMTKKIINITVPVVLDVEQDDGSVQPELVDMDLKIKRLTESQANHIFNRKLAGKKVSDMTPEELDEEDHFRSNFLATTVVEPKMSAEVWYNEVPAIASGTIFNKVQEVLGSIDNTDLFQ